MVINYLTVAFVTLLPAAVSVLLQLPKSKAWFEKRTPVARSLWYGVIYGVLTCFIIVMSTVRLFGNTGNVICVVDAPPIIAGLLFDAPAGIIAGIIGGICRYATVLWAGDSLLRIAGVFGLLLSGILATVVKKTFFSEEYKSNFIHALFFAVLIEIFSFTLVFLFNLKDLYKVFSELQVILLPDLICIIVSVSLSVYFVRRINHEPIILNPTLLIRSFEKFMLCSILVAVVLMLFFSSFISNRISIESYTNLLSSSISDIRQDTENVLEQDMMESVRLIAMDFRQNKTGLSELAKKYGVSEIHIIQGDTVVQSNVPEIVGYDMRSAEQSDDFMDNILAAGTYVQPYRPMGINASFSRKYAGILLDDRTILEAGYDTERFQEAIRNHISQTVKYRHIGTDGEFLVYSAKGSLIASRTELGSHPNSFFDEINRDAIPTMQLRQSTRDDENYTWMYTQSDGFYILAIVPTSEVLFSRDLTTYTTLFIGVILFSFIFALIYYLLKQLVINELAHVNDGLGEVTQGNLDTVIDVRSNREFIELSDGINQMIASMKGLIRDAETRYEKELNYAKIIQYSVLPSVRQFCGSRKDIQLYASMTTAEDVGGDFFDFYTVKDNQLAFCIADVSGKGIPAAMFMMRVKTLLRSSMEKYNDLKIAFEETNRQICESNEGGLFVTVWMGVCDLQKGILQFVNAGHNPPLLYRYCEVYERLKTHPNLVVGGSPRTKYQVHSIAIQPGDRIFLYTDGVTEARNPDQQLFGEKRLLSILNQNMEQEAEKRPSIEENCRSVHSSVNEFASGTKQFDDITMLGVGFIFLRDGDHAQFSGDKDSVRYSQNFLAECNQNHRIPQKTAKHIMICSDEIMSNIIKHGGAKKIHIGYSINNNAVFLEFVDNGILYDPTQSQEPDTTLSARERRIGGLGLLMVKKLASSVEYVQRDGWNDLKLIFKFETDPVNEVWNGCGNR